MGDKPGREMEQGGEKKSQNEIDVAKGVEGISMGVCRVCLESSEDSSHSTSLTQIQTSQEADGFRKR